MQSIGPDLTETTTASREPSDAEPPAAELTAAPEHEAAPASPAPELAPESPAPGLAPESRAPETLAQETAGEALPDPDPAADAPPQTPVEFAPASAAHPDAEPEHTRSAAVEDAYPEDTAPGDPGDDLPNAGADPQGVVRSRIPIAEGPPPPARVVFADLGLSPEVLRAIGDMGYRHPTPIQEQAIPYVLMGRDVMGTAQTGTGKTAGFTLPMLDILNGSRARARMPRSLILEPTRELALQVAENFVQYGKYLKLTHALIIGGESMSDQKEVLNRGVDVLIATPGRLLDMFDRGTILLSDTRLLVIDEADRMLDMGFIPDVERIVSMLPKTRQTLFFSATMGPEIRRLGDAFLTNPKEIAVSRAASVATTITEGLALVAEHDKREALRRLIRSQNVQNALIFCNRKRDVDILHKSLTKHHFDAGALHGDMAQTVRFSTLEKFKANELRLLVCSDVAARGLDIGGLSHVFNFDVPIHAEDYVHRIGRTGRAGLEGRAFTIASPGDRYAVEQIEKLTGHAIPPILVEGLDPVDWAEKDARKRRGRKTAEPKKAAEKAKPREAKEKTAKPAVERVRTRKKPAAQPEPVVVAEILPLADEPRAIEPLVQTEVAAPQVVVPRGAGSRRVEAKRDDHRRDDHRRDEHRRDEPKRDEPGRAEFRRDEPKRDEHRRDEPRRDDHREAKRDEHRRDEHRRDEPRRDDSRRERYRRDDDLGPSVVGFGDDVPAFMFLRTRPPHAAERRETDA
jgi:superfamily II DNA/RNA helicase